LDEGAVAKKVLIISGVFPPTRIAEGDHVLHLCKELSSQGLDISVLTTEGATGDGNLPFRVHPIMRDWNWMELGRLIATAKRFAPDTVLLWFVGHIYKFHPMISLVPTILKRVLPGVRVVTQITFPIATKPWETSYASRSIRKAVVAATGSEGADYYYGTLLRDSDQVIVMANSHLKEFAKVWPRVVGKSVLIPPPPLVTMSRDSAETRREGRQRLGFSQSDFVFGFFGRLRRFKGLETLVEAFQRVRARHTNAKLAVIGGADVNWFKEDWNVERLHEAARAHGIADSIAWTGEYPWDSNLGSTYLRSIDAAILPFDGGIDLNNSSFAAVAAHGLPTVATRGVELEPQFRDGENILLCAPKDPPALAAAMERVMIEGALRDRLTSGIEVLANDWFSWQVSAERTIAALDASQATPVPARLVPTEIPEHA